MSTIPQSCQAISTALYRDTALLKRPCWRTTYPARHLITAAVGSTADCLYGLDRDLSEVLTS